MNILKSSRNSRSRPKPRPGLGLLQTPIVELPPKSMRKILFRPSYKADNSSAFRPLSLLQSFYLLPPLRASLRIVHSWAVEFYICLGGEKRVSATHVNITCRGRRNPLPSGTSNVGTGRVDLSVGDTCCPRAVLKSYLYTGGLSPLARHKAVKSGCF